MAIQDGQITWPKKGTRQRKCLLRALATQAQLGHRAAAQDRSARLGRPTNGAKVADRAELLRILGDQGAHRLAAAAVSLSAEREAEAL